MRSDGRTLNILAMAAGAVQVVLFPSVVHLLGHCVAGSLVILVPKLLSSQIGGDGAETKYQGEVKQHSAGENRHGRTHAWSDPFLGTGMWCDDGAVTG